MPKPIIEVQNLSKLYRLGIIGATTLRDSLERWWLRRFGRDELARKVGAKHLMIEPDDPQAGPEPNTLWALKDISFSVQKGEVLGVIGCNGAGKSTLLKILSRITEPTSGRAVIRGRAGSLLEVGTGFHPDLTGRDNIYLNGAILGMRKSEITRKFGEIVAFSEVEKFIDTPVKRYSSGMYVRLAFAVAAHLEPEILIVDEVLAVGDVAFQKKCLGKMGQVSKEGRTVLFVSHNMGAIAQLCPNSILLDRGRIEMAGMSQDVVNRYLSKDVSFNTDVRLDHEKKPKNEAVFTRCWVCDENGQAIPAISGTKEFYIGMQMLVRQEISNFDVSALVYTAAGQQRLFSSNLSDMPGRPESLQPGTYDLFVRIPANFLVPGSYSLTIVLHRPRVKYFDSYGRIFDFEVIETGGRAWQYGGHWGEGILVDFPWQVRQVG